MCWAARTLVFRPLRVHYGRDVYMNLTMFNAHVQQFHRGKVVICVTSHQLLSFVFHLRTLSVERQVLCWGKSIPPTQSIPAEQHLWGYSWSLPPAVLSHLKAGPHRLGCLVHSLTKDLALESHQWKSVHSKSCRKTVAERAYNWQDVKLADVEFRKEHL